MDIHHACSGITYPRECIPSAVHISTCTWISTMHARTYPIPENVSPSYLHIYTCIWISCNYYACWTEAIPENVSYGAWISTCVLGPNVSQKMYLHLPYTSPGGYVWGRGYITWDRSIHRLHTSTGGYTPVFYYRKTYTLISN
jgi:hypothetical protein